jgi:hypothetical protein
LCYLIFLIRGEFGVAFNPRVDQDPLALGACDQKCGVPQPSYRYFCHKSPPSLLGAFSIA